MTKAQELFETLRNKGLTISFAESLTAGLACSSIAQFPGASEVLMGGVVTYNNEVKQDILGVDLECSNPVQGVSADVARAMAVGLFTVVCSNIRVSFTGFASPTTYATSVVGVGEQVAFIGVSTGTSVWESDAQTHCIQAPYPMDRNVFRAYVVEEAFNILLTTYLKESP